MIAARLVGETRFGLIDLVERYLGTTLNKAFQKANWSRRPLPPEMREYAIKDTCYLHDVADHLTKELEKLGRLEWLRESCERLVADCVREKVVDSDRVWRLRGSDRLDRRGLQVLRALWQWRDEQALRANRPPYFVVSHQQLVTLSEALQTTAPSKLELPPRMSPGRQRGLRQAASRAIRQPQSTWPDLETRKQKESHPKQRGDPTDLKKIRNAAAEKLAIDPTLIANRSQLEKLAFDWEEGASEMMSWQLELLKP
jgi:ribonuclease D